MSDTFRCDDKETLVAYLYGEIDADTRRQVEGHLRTCSACTREIEGLQDVRHDLESWMPPEPELGFTIVQKPAALATMPAAASTWSSIPAWARYAAAVLMMGVGIGMANVHVRYAADGVTVTTGWMQPSSVTALPPSAAAMGQQVAPQPVAQTTLASEQEWRQALTQLEAEMRRELDTIRQTSATPSAGPVRVVRASQADSDAMLKQMRTLVADSERRQQRELALRLLQFDREMNARRLTDLARIDNNLGHLNGRTAIIGENMNAVIRRVSSQPQQ